MEGKFEAALARIDAAIWKLRQPYSPPLDAPWFPTCHPQIPIKEVTNPHLISTSLKGAPIKMKFPNFKEVKLPNFKGGDPTNWILGVEHFFEFYGISDAQKLKYAWLGLSGSATLWYYKHIKPRIHEISWSLFLEKLIDQFDSTELEDSNKSIVVDEVNVIDVVSCEKNRDGVVFDSLENLEMENYRSDKSSKVFDELENQGKEKLIDQFGILEIEIDDADLGRKIQEDVVVEDCDVVEGENQNDDKAAVALDEKPSIVAISIDGGALQGLFSSTLLPLSNLVSVVGGHFSLDNEIVMKAFGVPKSYMKLLFLMQTVAKSTVERRLCFDPGGKVEFSKKRVERYIHTGACRMLFDCAALGTGLYASFISLLPVDQRSNYGRGRTESVLVTVDRHEWSAPPQIYTRDDNTGFWMAKPAIPLDSSLFSSSFHCDQVNSRLSKVSNGGESGLLELKHKCSNANCGAGCSKLQTDGDNIAEISISHEESNMKKRRRVEEDSSVDGSATSNGDVREHNEKILKHSPSLDTSGILDDRVVAAPNASLAEQFIEPTLIMFEGHVPPSCMLDGVQSQHFFGTGIIVYHTENMGLAAVDRNTVAVSAPDVMLSFAAFLIEIPGEVVFLHPVHNYALVAYDPSALGAGASLVRAAELLPEPVLGRGDSVYLVGLSRSLQATSRKSIVTNPCTALNIGSAESPLVP